MSQQKFLLPCYSTDLWKYETAGCALIKLSRCDCADQIFTLTLRRVLKHRFRYLQPTLTYFIDFAAAFDSIERTALWRMMERDGVPEKIVRLIKAFYERTSAQVCVYGELTDSFEIRTGVH
ncbi:unnamed protein product [Dracunculus medinensis]|uniref:Reverse transcriptase domain-containing protein n=1 Tax=Dracunculus medinensis TaxID=318479 RepID=A0A0N4UNC7_DRAME|nr:unnamed protein product [Dracunculus medinensis]